MKLTEEQHEKLKKYEKHLRRAFYGNYIYAFWREDFDALHKLYKETGGRDRINYSCSTCNLVMLKFLGKLYFEWKPDENPLPEEVVKAVLEEETDVQETEAQENEDQDNEVEENEVQETESQENEVEEKKVKEKKVEPKRKSTKRSSKNKKGSC